MRDLLLPIVEHRAHFLCALILAGGWINSSSAQTRTSNARAGDGTQENSSVQVTLMTDRNSYQLGDEISVKVLLTNRSRSVLYIFGPLDWGESASLSLWLKDAVSGKDVPQEFIADALTPPPSSKEAFVKLPPNHVYGLMLTLKLATLSVRKSGTYDLIAQYHSPIPSSMSFGLPTWSREKGAVASNRVTIAVSD